MLAPNAVTYHHLIHREVLTATELAEVLKNAVKL